MGLSGSSRMVSCTLDTISLVVYPVERLMVVPSELVLLFDIIELVSITLIPIVDNILLES